MTERTNCTFKASEYTSENGGIYEPWIMVETDGAGIKSLENGFIGFDLREGVTFEEALEIAKLLDDKISAISFTKVK
jgi:hypothetical protein